MPNPIELDFQMYVFLTFCNVPPDVDITADLQVSLSRLSLEFLHSCVLSLLPSENSNSKLSFLLILLIVLEFVFIKRLISLPPLFIVGNWSRCLLWLVCHPKWFLWWLSVLAPPNGNELRLLSRDVTHFDNVNPVMTPTISAAITKSSTIEALDVWICGSKYSEVLCDDGAEIKIGELWQLFRGFVGQSSDKNGYVAGVSLSLDVAS